MKQFYLLWVVLGFALLSTCCHALGVAPPTARAPKVVHVSREVAVTLHVDTAFNGVGRAIIVEAAERWRRLTRERAEITVVFDLDFSSVEGLRAHNDAKDSQVIGLLSTMPIAGQIDEVTHARDPRYRPLAATIEMPKSGQKLVFLILDRIDGPDFLAIVTHEFGHVIGLPDMPTTGSIMSGAQRTGDEPPADFTPADIALCRASRLCD